MRKLILFLLILFLLPNTVYSAACRDCDGTDDEISVGNLLNVTTGDASLCSWFQTDEDGTRDHISGKKAADTASAAGYRLYQIATSDGIAMQVSDGTDQQTSSSADYDTVWIWACGTWLAASEVTEIWINGAMEDSDTGAGAVGSLSNASSYQMCESSADDDDMNGRIAYAHNFAAVLTAVEINELMWKPESIVISAPNGFWAMWGDSPELDLSVNSNTATIVAGATENSDGPHVMFGGGLPL